MLFAWQGNAQLSNLRYKKIAVHQNATVLDSFSIVPGTVIITNIAKNDYAINDVAAILTWINLPTIDSVWIEYRVFPYRFTKLFYRYRYDSVVNNFVAAKGNRPKNMDDKLINFGNMTYNGSFGRSLSFGNAQNAVVNSVFNLQISGFLSDSMELTAAITDNNIPIQPDGTTQQLNEFDRIWLQFKRRPWEFNIGDIDVRQQPSYFLNFYKRQQGLSFATNYKTGKNTHKLFTSGAIAKGKFTRNIFQGIEGNQGPYRLQGANNELFFIILAGTERVFIDGVQMQRGEDMDYVINYNTAELSFTPRQMITKDKRIQIEFEYADRNFLNTLLYVNNEMSFGKKFTLHTGYYSNADSKNSTINQSLDKFQRQFLSQIGDSVQNALYPTPERDTFSITKILYKKIDTVINAQAISFYRYYTTYDTALYKLTFTDVGINKGNYVQDYNAANGKVYKWLLPINGVPQGNFEPVSILVTPKQQQLYSLAASYKISAKSTIKLEYAISKWDVNTLSSKQKSNDYGNAFKLSYNTAGAVRIAAKKLAVELNAAYEQNDKQFKPVERLRNVEFYRDWGLPYIVPSAVERLPSLSLRLTDTLNNVLGYKFESYNRSDNFNGYRHWIDYNQVVAGWQLMSYVNLSSSKYQNTKGSFLKPKIDLQKTFTKLNNYVLGFGFYQEKNEQRSILFDTLAPISFEFSDVSAFIKSNQAKLNRFTLQYFNRTNKLPISKSLLTADDNHNFTLIAELAKSIKHKFRVNGTYRILNIKNKAITTQLPEKTLLSRFEYDNRLLKGAIITSVLYEIGAGQEQRRDYTFIEVPAGQGEYTWIDYNTDGVPQLNEFEIAQFQDQAKYIRIFTPTNQFVKASYNTLNYNFNFTPRIIWAQSANSFKKFIGKFVLQSSLQQTQKVISKNSIHYNPFVNDIADTNIISQVTNYINTLSFNRFSTAWGIDLNNYNSNGKSLLTYGLETRKLNSWSLRTRVNATRKFTIEATAKLSTNGLSIPNPKFTNRNYVLNNWAAEPKITYTKNSNFRSILAMEFQNKKNVLGALEHCKIQTIYTETKYNAWQSAQLNFKLRYSNIQFNGIPNTTVAYIMLDALQPGKNFLWTTDLTKRLAGNLELSLQYEGRKAGSVRTVHVGRASLRAIF